MSACYIRHTNSYCHLVRKGIRTFEIAVQSGIEHYVWGSLDYSLKKGRFDEKFRCGHYDGKGKVAGMYPAQSQVDEGRLR